MARTCTICAHDRRQEIDVALACGQPSPKLAREFAVSEDALDRHRVRHLAPAIKAEAKARERLTPQAIVDELERLADNAKAIEEYATAAVLAGNLKPSEWARVSREARGANETLARLNGLLRDGSQTIVNNDNRRIEVYQQELRDLGVDRDALRVMIDQAKRMAELPAAS